MSRLRLPRPRLLWLVPLLLLAACTAPPDEEDADGAPYPWPDQAPGERWQPPPGVGWQWQLTGRLDLSVNAPVYDVDGFTTTKEQVAALAKAGRKTICYLSTGAWEDFRPDADAFPKALLGRGNGWEGERWLDIRRPAELEPLIAARFDMCRDKGFDAVEPDNMDGYRNATGFPLTAADQLAYNRLIARLAHERGLAVGLKNDLDQVPELVGDFDFAVNEQCAQYRECDRLTPFTAAGKAVFHVEYELAADRFCDRSRELGLSSLEKRYGLGAWRKAC
ncbi:endo alpha-1,4 polygalactosaminidase [Streptomyces subrutilus]|uniref:Endo alpha-1,4 polygalactosaminidase n=1 Tax=Streptomyces subrutilus TaxID=36818 RepID=A0A5P2UVY7_9ACTN|nr:endo alpha-1,4 polygalactosaminidase [Streptomyces subrutilus]QEU80907.1 endo alpha-1,4 polygalactosaminidase [Streptomyces subrutilus]GGZ66981.1 endo alpha-1,4 polygalactosaminidase [Streptomyces subrutilus]